MLAVWLGGVKGVGPEPWTQEVKLHVCVGGVAAMKMRAEHLFSMVL